MIKTAVMGYGTIGSGVAEILDQNKAEVAKSAGQEVELKYVLDLRDFPDSPVADKIIHDFKIIEEDPEVQVVVETMGGLNPAYPFVKACLLAGKHVVTSNKALVAAYGTELLAIAKEKQVNFFFEASVGGGIPIIRPLYRCLMGERIEEITGILNGTTNYILTKMDKEGETFENALKEAQNLGYAERNPEADVEGHDTCRKIAILTSMATGKTVNYEDIYTEGITNISKTDMDYVKKMGCSIKLLATADFENGKVWARVAPAIVNKENPLSMVNDVFNAILLQGNMLGDVMFYGKGAGKLPTASAVVSDIVEAVNHKNINLGIGWSAEKQELMNIDEVETRKFVRIEYNDKEKAKADVKSVFGVDEVIEFFGLDGEFAFVTNKAKEKELNDKLNELLNCDGVVGILNTIRVED